MSNDLCLGVRNSDFSQLAFFNQCQVGQEGKGLPVTPEFLPQMQESTGDMQGGEICGVPNLWRFSNFRCHLKASCVLLWQSCGHA